MSLLSTYTDSNKVTNTLLSVRYTTEFFEDGYYYRLTRTAKKSYAYTGMTRTAAEACAAAKIAQYTRNCCREDGDNPVTDPDGRTHPGVYQELVCVASVSVSHDHDDSWRCDIEVDESDYLAKKDPPVDAVSAFTQYVSSRTYDETIPGLTITSVTCNYAGNFVDVNVHHSGIDGITENDIFIQYKTSSSASSWSNVTGQIFRYHTGSADFDIRFYMTITDGYVFRAGALNRVSPAFIYHQS